MPPAARTRSARPHVRPSPGAWLRTEPLRELLRGAVAGVRAALRVKLQGGLPVPNGVLRREVRPFEGGLVHVHRPGPGRPFFFLNDPAPPEVPPLPLHAAVRI